MKTLAYLAICCPAVLWCPRLAADEHPARARRPASAEQRALRYLAREVPAWDPKNKCFSCHNNGDAARALYVARSSGFTITKTSLKSTNDWLKFPQRWSTPTDDEPFKDKKLARLQFTFALGAAVASKTVRDKKPLQSALDRLVDDQQRDGSWKIAGNELVGSPVTYGPTLATALAHRELARYDRRRYAAPIRKAEEWMLRQNPQTVLDAAALLWGLSGVRRPQVKEIERRCLRIIKRGQRRSGGWGAFVNDAAEPFDTAIVLLALTPHRSDPTIARMIRRGRRYLANAQLAGGGWNETTRPTGRESYAQRVSTSAWALLALLATAER